jgi:DNA polymerase-3 subunit delta'
MKFENVIGQEEVKSKLRGMVNSGHIPHAMMFLGPEGNGALPMALAFAQYLNCENKSDIDSCGVCPSCQKTQKFIHPDLHFTFPVIKPEKQKDPPVSTDYITQWREALTSQPYMSVNDWLQYIEAENKQGNITVRECHEIIRHINLKTYESGYKIQLIWRAEFLKEAGNTLLKVIEEPPANTIFILVVENIEQVLTTVISRTQIVKINAIDDADVEDALLRRFEMEPATAERIARIADGNFNAALNYAGGDETGNDKRLHKWLVACYSLKLKPSAANTNHLFEWVDDTAKIGRENQKLFLKYALFFIRECTYLSLTGESKKLVGEELKFASGLSSKLGPIQLEQLSEVFNQAYYHIERNANPKTLLTSTSFKISTVFAGQEVV